MPSEDRVHPPQGHDRPSPRSRTASSRRCRCPDATDTGGASCGDGHGTARSCRREDQGQAQAEGEGLCEASDLVADGRGHSDGAVVDTRSIFLGRSASTELGFIGSASGRSSSSACFRGRGWSPPADHGRHRRPQSAPHPDRTVGHGSGCGHEQGGYPSHQPRESHRGDGGLPAQGNPGCSADTGTGSLVHPGGGRRNGGCGGGGPFGDHVRGPRGQPIGTATRSATRSATGAVNAEEIADDLFVEHLRCHPQTGPTATRLAAQNTFEFGLINLLKHRRRCDLFEVYCSPDSSLSAEVIARGGTAIRIGLPEYDMLTDEGYAAAERSYAECAPETVWTSAPCDPWCSWHNINSKRFPGYARRQRRRKAEGDLMCYRALEFCRKQIARSKRFVFEWSRFTQGWSASQPMEQFLKEHFDILYWADVAGCCVDCRDPWTLDLLSKEWSLLTNCPQIVRKLNLRCNHDFKHNSVEGRNARSTAYYPQPLVVRAVDVILDPGSWACLLLELTQKSAELLEDGYTRELELEQDADANLVIYEEESAFAFVALPKIVGEKMTIKEQRLVDTWLHHFHKNSGHPTKKAMEILLRRRRVRPGILERLQDYRCPTCAELKTSEPRNPASHRVPEGPWLVVGSDLAEWAHPDESRDEKARLFFVVCEYTRVPIAAPWCIHRLKEHRNITSMELFEMFMERWVAYYRKPQLVRADSEGAWRGKDLQNLLAEVHVELDLHPGQASWQNGITERTIQTSKRMANKLAKDFPELTTRVIWAMVIDAYMELERAHGYAPVQWAQGRLPTWENTFGTDQDSPVLQSGEEHFRQQAVIIDAARKSFFDAKAVKRLERATRARARRDHKFRPGDPVMIWRSGKGLHGRSTDQAGRVDGHQARRDGKRGSMYGVARVLASETEVDPQDGSRAPRPVVWCVYGGYLLKCAPEQLQPASRRQQMLSELDQPATLPWTFDALTQRLLPGSYHDVSRDIPDADDLDERNQDEPLLKMPRTRRSGKTSGAS